MADYSIKLQLPTIRDINNIINGQVFPLLEQAVAAIASEVRRTWIDAVYAAPLWSVEKDAYAKSIRIDYWGDGLRADIIADYDLADEIENGRPPKDLKPALLNSPKVRRTKDGRRFLVVPMRQNTPGNSAHAPAMPASVYDLASQMTASKVTGSGYRPAGEVTNLSPTGGMSPAAEQSPYLSSIGSRSAYLVNQNSYNWGGKVTRQMLAEAGASKADQRKYAGMVRMQESTGGSSYLTFRTVIDGSSGWVIKARPGMYLARNVADAMRPVAEAALNEAVRREGLA